MQDQQPVAFHTGSLFALFDKQGVSLHLANSEISSYFIPHGTWALSGSWCGGQEINRPCVAFNHVQQPGIHVIHTGSAPRWARQEYAVVYDMDVWSLEELESLMYVISLSVVRCYITTRSLLKLNLESGATLYKKFGPNPRIIINILVDPSMEVEWQRMYRKEIAEWQEESTVISLLLSHHGSKLQSYSTTEYA